MTSDSYFLTSIQAYSLGLRPLFWPSAQLGDFLAFERPNGLSQAKKSPNWASGQNRGAQAQRISLDQSHKATVRGHLS